MPLNRRLRLVITSAGHRIFRKEFLLSDSLKHNQLDSIFIAQTSDLLQEVVVMAERPPVLVRNDTIEFNASSFKTLPSALVEDLLRKLPGVEVDRTGNIRVNGQAVNRIMVDGKSFFGNDPKMATRNLPANLIDKVQVSNDVDEINRSVNGDMSEIGKVINLTLKKGVKKGWFGKLYAGGGTDDRKEIGGIANIFRDTLQISILGFNNNVNRSSFSMKDVQELGGFNRSGTNSASLANKAGNVSFSINDISFGGMDNGITDISGAGINVNHAPNPKSTFYGQYFFGRAGNILNSREHKQQFITDITLNSETQLFQANRRLTHFVSAGLKLKPDSLTTIDFDAISSKSDNNNSENSVTRIENSEVGLLSMGDGNNHYKIGNLNYEHRGTLTRKSRQKKNRLLNLSHQLTYRSNNLNKITEQDNLFKYPVEQDVIFQQMRINNTPALNTGLMASVNEPISKFLSARIFQEFNLISDEQLVRTFGRSVGDESYNVKNIDLSDELTRRQMRWNSTFALIYRLGKVNLTAGANGLWQNVVTDIKRQSFSSRQKQFNLLPTFSVNWKQLSLNYGETVTSPNIIFLSPVVDNTNQYDILQNNPNLKLLHSKILRGNFNRYIPKSSLNIGILLIAKSTHNDVIYGRLIDSSGVQRRTPTNVENTQNLLTSLTFGKQFNKHQKLKILLNSRIWFNYIKQPIIVNHINGSIKSISLSPSVAAGLNWKDIVEFRTEYRIFLNRTKYTIDAFKSLYIPTHNFDGELIVRLPNKFVWELNANYRLNRQVAPHMPKASLLMNAALNYLMLKDNKGQLKLSVYDILSQNNSFYRLAVENYITDYTSNVLQRYFLLTFTYNIHNLGNQKKIGGRERLLLF